VRTYKYLSHSCGNFCSTIGYSEVIFKCSDSLFGVGQFIFKVTGCCSVSVSKEQVPQNADNYIRGSPTEKVWETLAYMLITELHNNPFLSFVEFLAQRLHYNKKTT
jgi:hypothetical protein